MSASPPSVPGQSALLLDHFALFSLPRRFAIDPAALAEAYRRVLGGVHPDRFAAAPDAERRLAMQVATQVNEAHRVLRDPTRRAAYLCTLLGVDVEAESNTAMPVEFLVQQMEWREALAEARASRDAASLVALRATLDAQAAALQAGLADALDVRTDASEAASLARRMMFLDKFRSEVDAAQDALLDA